jgi:nitroimidazol reductase NimA-like FMN-containing flavoprotein (pyridoxamine 5'-phosphate oxidase superfamily)
MGANMQRKEREITEFEEIEEIIEKADVCRIALSDNNIPYIVTMNYGYKKGNKPVLFLHSAKNGKKIDIIKRNNVVCFQMSVDHKLGKTQVRCNCGMNYKSLVGMGRISFVTDKEEKIEALNNIVNRYTLENKHIFEEKYVGITTVLRIDIDHISGKKCSLQPGIQ